MQNVLTNLDNNLYRRERNESSQSEVFLKIVVPKK